MKATTPTFWKRKTKSKEEEGEKKESPSNNKQQHPHRQQAHHPHRHAAALVVDKTQQLLAEKQQLLATAVAMDYGAMMQEAFRRQSFSSSGGGGRLNMMMATESLKAMIREWNVKIPPAKKHMVAGQLVPTVRGVAGAVLPPTRHRTLAIEIHGPPDDMRVDERNENDEGGTNNVLEDHDIVVLHIYMTAETSDVNDDDDDDGGGDGEDKKFTMKSYRIEDIMILGQRNNTCEVQVGSGDETKVYDIRFQSEEDSLNFAEVVEQLRASELERSKRQAEIYKGKQMEKKNSKKVGDDLEASINLLVEIVSATSLPTAGTFSSRNPYVIVKMGGTEIHRTKVLSKTVEPIWTLETGSLFLVQMDPEEFFSSTGGMTLILADYHTFGANRVLGRVRLGLQQILKMTGKRETFAIVFENDIDISSSANPRLHLRIKEASKSDIQFMMVHDKCAGLVGVYADETYLLPRPPDIDFLKRNKKRIKNDPDSKEKILVRRVRPYPDPARPDETEWLSTEQIERESQNHSTNWVDAGSGKLGRLFVEILHCDGLPNMDLIDTSNVLDTTDAFVCLVYEDTIVNTDVIGDSNSPRWMPWSKRAFCFPVAHSQSDLFIGIFDYDMERSPVQMALRVVKRQHRPIGRCSVCLTQLNPDTLYTLTYPIYYSELRAHRTQSRGTITVRLRLEWNDTRRTMLTALKPPAPHFISCPRKIHWEVSRYTVEGVHDGTKYSMNSFARYITELQSYREAIPYIEEALMTTWLWRGHYAICICGKTVWLPLHSVAAFSWALIIYSDLNYIPSFLVFSIGWIFLITNEIVRRTPSKWNKPRGYGQLWSILLFGSFFIENIEPNENLDALREFEEKQRDIQTRRENTTALRAEYEDELQKELGSGINESDVDNIATKAAEGLADSLNVSPLKPILHPVQLKLRRIVLTCRFTSKFFLWKETYYAFWITTFSFFACALVALVPWGVVLRWVIRVSLVVMLGPWMKLVDWYFFHQTANMTEEEHNAHVKQKLQKRFDAVIRAISDYQVKKERAAKLKSMKKYLYGKFIIRIPRVSLDLFQDYPLPESFANVFQKRTAKPIVITERKFGQHLTGDMIPVREIQASDLEASNLKDVRVGFGSGPFRWIRSIPQRVGEKAPLLATKQRRDRNGTNEKENDSVVATVND